MAMIFFVIIVVSVISFLARLFMIEIKVRSYIKKNYPGLWADNLHILLSGGRMSVFQVVADLKDPYIMKSKRAFHMALTYMIVGVLAIFAVAVILALLKMI